MPFLGAHPTKHSAAIGATAADRGKALVQPYRADSGGVECRHKEHVHLAAFDRKQTRRMTNPVSSICQYINLDSSPHKAFSPDPPGYNLLDYVITWYHILHLVGFIAIVVR